MNQISPAYSLPNRNPAEALLGGIANRVLPADHHAAGVAVPAVRSQRLGSKTDSSQASRTSAQPGRPASDLLQHLVAMGKGNHPALAKCYDLMGPVVFSLAVRMLRDRAAAEDVTQDIFVQVWRQSANFDAKRGSPEAWIMMIARTRILDRLRSRSAGIILKPVGDHLPDSPDGEDWPTELAISREDAVNVRAALAALPVDQKQAVEMAFFDGLTHGEIAEQLKVPLGTIKTRIRLGLMKIKDRLSDGFAERAASPILGEQS